MGVQGEDSEREELAGKLSSPEFYLRSRTDTSPVQRVWRLQEFTGFQLLVRSLYLLFSDKDKTTSCRGNDRRPASHLFYFQIKLPVVQTVE